MSKSIKELSDKYRCWYSKSLNVPLKHDNADKIEAKIEEFLTAYYDLYSFIDLSRIPGPPTIDSSNGQGMFTSEFKEITKSVINDFSKRAWFNHDGGLNE